jgi:hypothetical protein
MFVDVNISCTYLSNRLEYNSLIIGLGGLDVRGSRQTFGSTSVDDKGDGINI